MTELFAPPPGGWTQVSPSLRRMRRLLLGLLALLALVAVVVPAVIFGFPLWLWALLLAVVALGAGWAWLALERNTSSWGYAEREEDLYITHGAMFRKLVVVPYGRMQYVDVQAGPFEQLFDIASVHLHTASPGTSARIPGLPKAEAARLRDSLTSLGEAQAAGL